MAEDRELSAMNAVFSALEPLEGDARVRVLQWVSQRLSIPTSVGHAAKPNAPPPPASAQGGQAAGDFGEFHALFDAARPKTNSDRALVGAYWFQVCQAQPDFASRQVNEELKQLGHPIANIADAFDKLQGHKPVLARQIQKLGKTKQAQKRYRVTQEGITRVAALISQSEVD